MGLFYHGDAEARRSGMPEAMALAVVFNVGKPGSSWLEEKRRFMARKEDKKQTKGMEK
jgi:hypothetical protein